MLETDNDSLTWGLNSGDGKKRTDSWNTWEVERTAIGRGEAK